MFDTLVFAGSPNKDFFKHTRLWSLIKTYFSSSGISTLNLQVSASSSIDSDNRALLFVRAKGSCSTDDVDSSSPKNRGSIRVRDHPFKTSACLRGGGVSPRAVGQNITVHKDKKSPS